MKKVLFSMLLVVLSLCLFISCNGEVVSSVFNKVEEPEPTPTPSPTPPTTKTISVIKEDNTEVFTFEILTSSTTWGDVIDDVELENNWVLSVNGNGRLELKNTSTPTDTYYVTQTLGEKFIKSTDTIGDTITIYMVNPDDYTMKSGDEWFGELVDGITPEIPKNQIKEIHFVKPNEYNPTTTGTDLTDKTTGKVKGYIVKDGENYKIYVVGDYIFGNDHCSQMFYSFQYLITLDLGNFTTSNVSDMKSMFSVCPNLTTLDLSKFDTSRVTNMSSMFKNCQRLTSLDLSKFDTSKVTNMSSMFENCQKLTSLDLSNFNTSSVTDMNKMFYYCKELTTITFGNGFNTSSVTDMNKMFFKCEKLTSLNLSNFRTSSVTNMNQMFNDCKKLETITFSNGFNTSSVTNMEKMFYQCEKLTSLNLSMFRTSSVTTMNNMFNNCFNLTSLDLSNFDTSSVTDMTGMFNNCGHTTPTPPTTITINKDYKTFFDNVLTNTDWDYSEPTYTKK